MDYKLKLNDEDTAVVTAAFRKFFDELAAAEDKALDIPVLLITHDRCAAGDLADVMGEFDLTRDTTVVIRVDELRPDGDFRPVHLSDIRLALWNEYNVNEVTLAVAFLMHELLHVVRDGKTDMGEFGIQLHQHALKGSIAEYLAVR